MTGRIPANCIRIPATVNDHLYPSNVSAINPVNRSISISCLNSSDKHGNQRVTNEIRTEITSVAAFCQNSYHLSSKPCQANSVCWLCNFFCVNFPLELVAASFPEARVKGPGKKVGTC